VISDVSGIYPIRLRAVSITLRRDAFSRVGLSSFLATTSLCGLGLQRIVGSLAKKAFGYRPEFSVSIATLAT
jgi:hypothetical protein